MKTEQHIVVDTSTRASPAFKGGDKRGSVSTPSVEWVDVAPAVPLSADSRQAYTYSLVDKDFASIPLYSLVEIPFGRQRVTGTILALKRETVSYPIKAIVRTFPVALTEKQVAFASWIAQTLQGGLGFTLRLFYPPLRSVSTSSAHQKTPNRSSRAEIENLPRKALSTSIVALQKALVKGNSGYIEYDIYKRIQALSAVMRDILYKDQQVLVLVPETWMIDRLIHTFPHWLAPYVVAVHTEQGPRALHRTWEVVRTRKACVVIGTQKALFLPYQQLRLIIVEEEQLTTHKLWDQYPRLHNTYAAEHLASIHEDARIVYTTSFPSLRLQYLTASGQLSRVGNAVLKPRITATTFSFADRQRHAVLPEKFINALQQWIQHKKHILLFYNRRGSWRALICRRCHAAVRCPQCGVSAVVHSVGTGKHTKRHLVCHHCAWRGEPPQRCSHCRHSDLTPIGIGTEKLTTALQRLLGKEIVKINADTLTHIQLSNCAARLASKKEGSVVVATSAIFAALPSTTFDRIAWLFPEHSLLYPDIRSEERAFILLARLQQFYPPSPYSAEHQSRPEQSKQHHITCVTRQSYLIERTLALSPAVFIEQQLKERKRLGYPPFRDMIRLTTTGKSRDEAHRKAYALRRQLEERLLAMKSTTVMLRGPFQSFIKRRKGKAEAHLLLLGALQELTSLYEGLRPDYVELAPERIL